jgi:hypothetical protein
VSGLPPIQPTGASTAVKYPSQSAAGPGPNPQLQAQPGDINTPILFEPGAALTGGRLVLYVIASGENPNWGGCNVWASVENPEGSYGILGAITTNATQGVTTDVYPMGADPDTTDTLTVDLTESEGSLVSVTEANADNSLTCAYIGNAPAEGELQNQPFELISYSSVELTSLSKYNLGTYIRRGVYNSTIFDHPEGSQFGLIYSAFLYSYPENLVGAVIYLKFPSFNTLGVQLQDISEVPYYSYKLTGAGSNKPIIQGNSMAAWWTLG